MTGNLSGNPIDQWMVRTASNRISGPLTQRTLIEYIEKGEIGALDEFSAANQYWVMLSETSEVLKFLGPIHPRVQDSDGERTDDLTLTQTESTDQSDENLTESSTVPIVPIVIDDEFLEETPEATAQLTNRMLREFHIQEKADADYRPKTYSEPNVEAMGVREEPRGSGFGVLVFLLLIIGAIVFLMTRRA